MIERALKLTREFHRMKQVELAEKLSISTSYLSEIEAGKKPPSLELLEGYARIFNVPASTFLLFGEQASKRRRGTDPKKNAHAERLLKFFEWVLSDEELRDDGEKEAKAPSPGAAKKAVRTESVRALRN